MAYKEQQISDILNEAMKKYHSQIEDTLHKLMELQIILGPENVILVSGTLPEYLEDKYIQEFSLILDTGNEQPKQFYKQWLCWTTDVKEYETTTK